MVSILGNACMALAFVFLGPLPIVNIEPTVASIQVRLGYLKMLSLM